MKPRRAGSVWSRRVAPGDAPAGLTALLLIPTAAGAHSFGRTYNLPVPFWLYGFGAAAALVLSFLIV